LGTAEIDPMPDLGGAHPALSIGHADLRKRFAQRVARKPDERRRFRRDVALDRNLFQRQVGAGRARGKIGCKHRHGEWVRARQAQLLAQMASIVARSNGSDPLGPANVTYLPRAVGAAPHSLAVRSSACTRPFSEYRSTDCVPRLDVPVTTRSVPLRMVSMRRASSAAFLIHAPSFCVYI